MTPIRIGVSIGLSAVLIMSSRGNAGEALVQAARIEQAVRANLLPLSPTYVTPKCLVPYPVCKFAFAAVSLLSGWEQLLIGGDLAGAQHSLERGFTGPWFVTPQNVSGDVLWSLPEPLPLVAYFATGENNAGAVPLDLALPSPAQSADGDILPP